MKVLFHAAAVLLLAASAAGAQEPPAEDPAADPEPPAGPTDGGASDPEPSGDLEPSGDVDPPGDTEPSEDPAEGDSSATPATAGAPQGPVSLRDLEAWQLFQAGQLAFLDDRFDEALDYFRRAHELSGRASLLVHIGRAAERMEEPEWALAAYEAYLEALPEAGDRETVEERLRVLREEIGDLRAASAERREVFSSGASAAPWVIVVAGGLVTVGGGVLLGVALSDKAAVEDAPDGSRYHDLMGRHERVGPFSTMGFFALGVGLAGVGAGLIWALGSDEAPVEAEVGVGALRLRGSF